MLSSRTIAKVGSWPPTARHSTPLGLTLGATTLTALARVGRKLILTQPLLRNLAQLAALDLDAVRSDRDGKFVEREDSHRHFVFRHGMRAASAKRGLVEGRTRRQRDEADRRRPARACSRTVSLTPPKYLSSNGLSAFAGHNNRTISAQGRAGRADGARVDAGADRRAGAALRGGHVAPMSGRPRRGE